MYLVSPLSQGTHQEGALADVARGCEVRCRLHFLLRFVEGRSESCFEVISIYVSSWPFQTRSATAGLSNVEGAFIKLATPRNFFARMGSRFAD